MAGPRTPLLRPHRYFSRHDGSPPLAHAAAVVALVTVAVAGGLTLFLGEFAAALDVTTTVDNPAYPGDAFCEDSAFEDTPTGCSEPKTVEREVGALAVEELSWVPAAAMLVVPLFWLFEAGVLHAASALVGGDGPFRDTLAVAGWGMAPAIVRLTAVGGFLVYRLRTLALSGSVDGAIGALRAAVAGVEAVSLAAALVVGLWGGAIRAYGLSEARDHTVREAALVVAVLTVIGLLYELV